MTLLEWTLLGACVAIVVAPPRYDSAIRLKYWLAGKRFGDRL